jgi:hypothetical protein
MDFPVVQYSVVQISNAGSNQYEIHYTTPRFTQKISMVFDSHFEAREFIKSLENLQLNKKT